VRLAWIAGGCLIAFGCDKVLGLTTVHPDPDALAPTHYTVIYKLRTVAGTPAGEAVTEEKYDPIAFLVRMADGTRPVISHPVAGTFEFDSMPQPYEIELVREQDIYTSRIQHSAPNLLLVETRIGRPGAVVPTEPTLVDFTQMATTSGAYDWQLYATGVPATIELALGAYTRLGSPIDWQQKAKGAGLVDHNQHDRLYYVEYSIDSNQFGYVSASKEIADLDMQQGSGVVNSLGTVPPTALPIRTARVVAHLPSELQRVVPTQMPGTSSPNMAVAVVSLAGDVATAATGLPLAGKGFTSNSNDVDTPVQFGNPVVGTQSAAALRMQWSRPFLTPGAAIGFQIPEEHSQLAPPYMASGSAGETAIVGDGTVGVISNVTLSGTSLGSDLTPVTLDPIAAAEVTWDVASGSFDWYQVLVVELVASNLVTEGIYVDSITTVVPHATIQADLLRPGHIYAFLIQANLGTPGAAQGDFATSTYPAGYEVRVPGVFTPALPKPPGP
jgi:hypothetical protein